MKSTNCHRCQRETPTVALYLSSGHIGNCCAICRATRKGKPFLSKAEAAELLNASPMPERRAIGQHERAGF